MVLLRRSRRFDLLLHLYGGTSQHTFLYFFQKSNFQKLLGPFLGPQGLLPTIFEFPYSRYVTSNFSRRFYPIFSWCYSGAPDVSTYFYIYTAAPHNTHTLSYTFSKNQIFKIFWVPFPGPQGLLPTIFKFPYSRYKTSNFFRRFYPIFDQLSYIV